MTAVRDALAAATARLAAAGIATPRVDAELLLAAVLRVPRGRLVIHPDLEVEAMAAYDVSIGRRAAREPLQHIVGTAPFRHLELAVGPGVFVPRPETELLVGALPALVPGDRVVDLCAGSGALALAVATEHPGVEVWAVERSPAALGWLRRNVADLAPGVHVVAADVADPALVDGPLAGLRAGVRAVVCNPPYVPAGTAVEPEVHADPAEAVFGGPDGLDLLPAVIGLAADLLADGGAVAIEHDDSHGTRLPELVAADGRFEAVVDRRDLAGVPRYVTATRRRTRP